MNPETGKIVPVKDEADAKARGLVPVPDGMNRKQRRAWAAEYRRANKKGGVA